MSQEKIEALVCGEDGIMLQEITVMRGSNYLPLVRMPTLEEVVRIADSCQITLKKMEENEAKDQKHKELLEMMYEETVKKHGEENVRMDEGKIIVMDKGKEHKIWVESL